MPKEVAWRAVEIYVARGHPSSGPVMKPSFLLV